MARTNTTLTPPTARVSAARWPGAGRAPRARAAAWLAALATAAAMTTTTAAGCVNFDREDQIADTRILAVRTEPAEILFSPLYLSPAAQRPPFPLPTTNIDVEVFAFDPRGGLVTTSVAMCPDDAGDSSCRLYKKEGDPDFKALVEPGRSEVDALLSPTVVQGEIDLDENVAGRVVPSRFSFAVTPSAIDFFQPKDGSGQNAPSIFPVLPRFFVRVENETQKDEGAAVFAERAFKRLPLTMDLADPTLPADFLGDLARAIGVELCAEPLPVAGADGDDFVEGPAACLRPRGPNANPGLSGFKLEPTVEPLDFAEGTLVATPDLGLESLVRADPGAQIALTPVWAEGTVERYQVLSFDIDTSKIGVENRVEDLACQWFVTRGATSRAQTAVEFTQNRLGVVWTLPEDAESGERDSLVLVALDQRGGTAVAQVSVQYR
ncbi:MAG: hypothetical protein FJ137_11295 [Deltaproteobacteria bacterium]|nr:hypothetical protein [Deltaproteobacteria bacterium]